MIPNSIKDDNKISLVSPSIPSETEVLTIIANDCHYIRISKQILQYELKRKRMNVASMSELAHLVSTEINIPTSSTSDWRLVLQDSITTVDIKQGCISLFDQVNSHQTFTQIEVNHASRFLQYATLHIKYRGNPDNKLLETIFPQEANCQTKLTSTLIKLICHPSDTFRTVALSFFDAFIRHSSNKCTIAVVVTGLLPQLFEHLKPQEIPLNGTTIDFHRHIISIVDMCLSISTTENIIKCLGIDPSSSRALAVTSELLDPIIQPFCTYLRSLMAPPFSPTDYHSGLSLLRNMSLFDMHLNHTTPSSSPVIQQFIDDLKNTMPEELASLLDLTAEKERLHELLFDDLKRTDESRWAKTFERIVVRLSEGRPISDVGLEAYLIFMSRRPDRVELKFWFDGTFSIQMDITTLLSFSRDGWFSPSKRLPLKALYTPFVPTQTHRATALLAAFERFGVHLDKGVLEEHVWSGWFSAFFDAINPSKLPFTNEFEPLHTQLVKMMHRRIHDICVFDGKHSYRRSREAINKTHRSFHKQTRDYIVHLSLHPFAFAPEYGDSIIVAFITQLLLHDDDDPMAKSLRDEVRKEMDEAARSSSSPPLILTSDLVCPLTDTEILNVVDRIVGLLESDSCLDDDTILRIYTFHTNQLKSVYLPELFRKAGRTSKQYFHTFQSLLSLPIDYFSLHPINSLLCPKPHDLQPTFDEWDDVDLATVGVVMQAIRDNRLTFKRLSSQFTQHLLDFIEHALHQVHYSAARLRQFQLEQLITPSIDILNKSFFGQDNFPFQRGKDRDEKIIDVCRLCDQHAIARCLSSVGYFSRMVGGVLDYSLFNPFKYGLDVFIDQASDFGNERAERTKLRRTIPLFLEEGWQDAVEFVLVKKDLNVYHNTQIAWFKKMTQFHGANIGDLLNLYDTD
ncbi:hypothetical protein BLNAU_20090 [Blattamonas nauphoetae]|uniref:Uncharacterized protein n=1 Tax=Blattamonas nauphoetae TaxID=2049346 RepID=A0ABQ9WZM5_9EUKA|nr:hypothetical protein BLNAU_20090 [Blattamonas nauphoetae]